MRRLYKDKGTVYLTNHETLQWLDEKHAEDDRLAALASGRSHNGADAKDKTHLIGAGLPPVNALKGTKDVRRYLSSLPGSSMSNENFITCLESLRKATFMSKEEKLMCLNARPSAVGELTLVLTDMDKRLEQMDGESLIEFLTSQIPAESQAEVKKARRMAEGEALAPNGDASGGEEENEQHLLQSLQDRDKVDASRKEIIEEMIDQGAHQHAEQEGIDEEEADEDMGLLHTVSAVDDPIERDD